MGCCFRRKRFCALCKLQTLFYKGNPFDNISAREFLDQNSENMQKLKQFAATIWSYFKRTFFFNRESLDFFNDVYVWKHPDWYTFETSEVTLKGPI